MNWFNLSFIGWLIVIIALALVAYKFDVPAVLDRHRRPAARRRRHHHVGQALEAADLKCACQRAATKKPAQRAGFLSFDAGSGLVLVDQPAERVDRGTAR